MSKTLFVMQGGGPTAVINTTLAGIVEEASNHYKTLIGLRHSFETVSGTKTIDLSGWLGKHRHPTLEVLAGTPGAILGSSRKKVEESDLESTLALMQQHNATELIGIGGNGTMYVLDQLARFAIRRGQPLNIVGAPKTVDNDIAGVAVAPGFGSAARFVALSVRDFDCDFRSMETFDNVTILETMGRNSGWLAASATLLRKNEQEAPHMVLVPEVAFNESRFLDRVARLFKAHGRVFIVSNEMLTDTEGRLVGEAFQNGPVDDLGRPMYSLSLGTGNYLADLVWRKLGLQVRCLRPGSLGRATSGCVSEFDRKLARSAGVAAVKMMQSAGDVAQMVSVNSDASLDTQAAESGSVQTFLPPQFICPEQPFNISQKFSAEYQHVIGAVEPLLMGVRGLDEGK